MTLFVKDLLVAQLRPNATEQEQASMVRVVLVILGVLAIAISGLQPNVIHAINWIFSWLIPVFVLCIIGLFWKRSAGAAISTMVVSWIINCLWSMTSFPENIGLANVHNAFVALAVSIILGLVLTAMLPGSQGFFKEKKSQQAHVALGV